MSDQKQSQQMGGGTLRRSWWRLCFSSSSQWSGPDRERRWVCIWEAQILRSIPRGWSVEMTQGWRQAAWRRCGQTVQGTCAVGQVRAPPERAGIPPLCQDGLPSPAQGTQDQTPVHGPAESRDGDQKQAAWGLKPGAVPWKHAGQQAQGLCWNVCKRWLASTCHFNQVIYTFSAHYIISSAVPGGQLSENSGENKVDCFLWNSFLGPRLWIPSFPCQSHQGLVYLWNSLPVPTQQSSNLLTLGHWAGSTFLVCHFLLNKALSSCFFFFSLRLQIF